MMAAVFVFGQEEEEAEAHEAPTEETTGTTGRTGTTGTTGPLENRKPPWAVPTPASLNVAAENCPL